MGYTSTPTADLPQSTNLTCPSSSTNAINGILSPPPDKNFIIKPQLKQLRSNAAKANKERNDYAVREAQREIRSKIGEDWEWPSSFPTNSPTTHFASDAGDIEWRERASDSEICSLESLTGRSDPFNVTNVNSVAQPVLGRKRKRRELLKEEMAWNEGLRNFVLRRDAWTGARPQHTQHHANANSPPIPSTTAQPTTDIVAPANTPPPSPSPLPDTLVPVAPPILPPDNIVRAGITPETYPSIYSKIIIQGRAPNIPVNLSDMVAALVQGWKQDGEWPPKSEAERSGVGVRRGGKRLARRGVGRFKQALRFRRGTAEGRKEGNEGDGEEE